MSRKHLANVCTAACLILLSAAAVIFGAYELFQWAGGVNLFSNGAI
jgi:hypothetical protein